MDVVEIVNASDWTRVDEGPVIRYFIGNDVRANEQLYLPFAWLQIDQRTQAIVAARDHFGQEPFYYYYRNQRLIFGSTIGDILQYLPQTPALTRHLIRDCFLRFPADDPLDDPPFVTETYYEGIFRVTPGHHLYIMPSEKYEIPFWKPDPEKPKLHYADEREYLEHFTMLLDEALQVTIQHERHLAAEFSGGMDSTMLFVACRNRGLEPELFTHVPPASRQATHEDMNVSSILEQFGWSDRHVAVNADSFDPVAVFQHFANILSGPAPNLNCILANNLHQAVVDKGFKQLISGFGGDDCVSLLFPASLLSSSPEALYAYEADLLQGKLCHENRMRLEYSAVVARSMGFSYVYPLLYPPLIEFCFSLPFEQKCKNGRMRCMVQDYLLQHIRHMHFSTKGGAVVPDTMQKCRDYYRQGLFSKQFVGLPFQQYIEARTTPDDLLLLQINAYMLKQALLMQHDRRRSAKSCAA